MKKTFNVREPYFSYIKEGKKTVEGRLNKGKFSDMQVGDIAVVNDNFEVKIIGTKKYGYFSEMIENEGINNVIPDAHTLEDAVNVYYRFYTKEQENKYGVVAIKMELL